MNLENVKYDAFISYRHLEKDMMVAKEVHKMLESFQIPRSVRKAHPELPKKISRVFRDQEELPLTTNLGDPIMEALKNSEYLIVICTPKLKESMWCQKEIETFIGLHGREKVFAVLAEGEPDESFPPQLLVDDAGNPIEPLGADARGENASEVRKKLQIEGMRLVAPMLGLNFDDLRQRHREQKMRRLIALGSGLVAALIIFGAYMAYTALTIQGQADEIRAQNAELVEREKLIIEKNEEIRAKSYDIAGRYEKSMAEQAATLIRKGRGMDAMYLLRNAMPDSKENTEEIPYLAEAERRLVETLNLYGEESSMVPVYTYHDEGVRSIAVSQDGQYFACLNENGRVSIIDSDSHELIYEDSQGEQNIDDNITFIGSDLFAYCTSGKTYIYRISQKERVAITDARSVIATCPQQRVFALGSDKNLTVYDMDTLSEQFRINLFGESKNGFFSKIVFSESGNYIYALLSDREEYGYTVKGLITDIVDVKSGEVVFSNENYGDYLCSDISCDDEMAICSIAKLKDVTNGSLYDYELHAYDFRAKKEKWAKKAGSDSVKSLDIVEGDSGKLIFAWNSSVAMEIDAETGETKSSVGGVGTIRDCVKLSNSGTYFVATNYGETYGYLLGKESLYNFNYIKYVPTIQMKNFAFSRGVYMSFWNEDYITQYRAVPGKNMEEIDELPEEYLSLYDAKKMIDEGEISYDLPNGYKLLKKNAMTPELLNEKGEVIATLLYCVGYDEKENVLLFSGNGTRKSKSKIATYDEIIQYADEMLEGYVPAADIDM